jgi:hypothetical protein
LAVSSEPRDTVDDVRCASHPYVLLANFNILSYLQPLLIQLPKELVAFLAMNFMDGSVSGYINLDSAFRSDPLPNWSNSNIYFLGFIDIGIFTTVLADLDLVAL